VVWRCGFCDYPGFAPFPCGDVSLLWAAICTGLGDGIFGFSSGSKADSLLKMSVSEFIIFGLFLWIYCLAVPCGFGCLRCVICYLLRADYFVLAICVFSLVNLGKGGKGDKTGRAAKSSAPKEQPPLELRVEQGRCLAIVLLFFSGAD